MFRVSFNVLSDHGGYYLAGSSLINAWLIYRWYRDGGHSSTRQLEFVCSLPFTPLQSYAFLISEGEKIANE